MSLPVIVGNGDSASLLADVDTTASVCDAAPLRTGVVACAGSTKCLVGVASRAKVNQAVRSLAVIFGRSAVSLEQVSYCNSPRSRTNIRHLSSSSPQRTWR
jgi:arginine deiminase